MIFPLSFPYAEYNSVGLQFSFGNLQVCQPFMFFTKNCTFELNCKTSSNHQVASTFIKNA